MGIAHQDILDKCWHSASRESARGIVLLFKGFSAIAMFKAGSRVLLCGLIRRLLSEKVLYFFGIFLVTPGWQRMLRRSMARDRIFQNHSFMG